MGIMGNPWSHRKVEKVSKEENYDEVTPQNEKTENVLAVILGVESKTNTDA